MSHYLSKKGQKPTSPGKQTPAFFGCSIAIVGKCYPTSVKLRLFQKFSHPR